MKRLFLLILSFGAAAFLVRCGLDPLAGGGTESTNGRVIGTLVEENGAPAMQTRVMLVANNYDPVKNGPVPGSMTDTTDSLGNYAFFKINKGDYSILALHIDKKTSAIIQGIQVYDRVVPVAADTLRPPGSVKVAVPAGADNATGYVYIPGTIFFAFLKNNSGFVMLDSVPAGKAADILYSTTATSASTVLRYGVQIISRDTAVVWNPGWNYARKFILNTSATGAGVSGGVTNFPVLVRLTADNFNFAQAGNNGDDIRFTKPDNTFLAYEIERWDPVIERAEVWVKVDTILGNSSTQSITMYWGGSSAASASNGPSVFDTANGFQGVWHLNEAGKTIAKDATGNHYDGTPSDTAPLSAEGTIGPCRSFNGSSNYIRMIGTANSKLNFPENGRYSVSAWAYADSIDHDSHLIVGKSNEQYYMKFKFSLPTDPMVWEFVEFHDKTGWYISNSLPAGPVARAWTYIVGVRNGSTQTFFINGQPVDSSVTLNSSGVSRSTSDDVTIGRFLSAPPDSIEGICPFLGKIDEVRISNVANSADWIKLSFMNQKERDALVKW